MISIFINLKAIESSTNDEKYFKTIFNVSRSLCGLNLWADLNEIIFYSCFLPLFLHKSIDQSPQNLSKNKA